MLQETQNTLQLINKENRVKSEPASHTLPSHYTSLLPPPAIPKAGCVFEFRVAGHQFTLYGSNMRYRAADRSARKFKDRASIDL